VLNLIPTLFLFLPAFMCTVDFPLVFPHFICFFDLTRPPNHRRPAFPHTMCGNNFSIIVKFCFIFPPALLLGSSFLFSCGICGCLPRQRPKCNLFVESEFHFIFVRFLLVCFSAFNFSLFSAACFYFGCSCEVIGSCHLCVIYVYRFESSV